MELLSINDMTSHMNIHGSELILIQSKGLDENTSQISSIVM